MEHKTDRKIKEYCYKFKILLDEHEERRKYWAQPELHSPLKSDQGDKTNVGPDDEDVDNNEEVKSPTCHKLRLYKGSLTSKGTDVMDAYSPREKKVIAIEDNVAEIESADVASEEPSELPVEEPTIPPSFTGFFVENNISSFKRIDLILVLADDGNPDLEMLRTNYLMSIIKCGLEIEMEHGMMPIHKHLVFAKVHAPESVLEEYGDIVGVKKYFKDSHMEYIKPKSFFLNRFVCFCTQLNDEKVWVQIVRSQYEPPLFYSNIERSLIVYKILLHLPYGEHVNDFGLERLLDRDIVLDVYPLHDGPYFYTNDQDFTEVNARQILFYYWIGLRNLFNMQPLNVIHEYFGSRVAFYFSFFQFYNQILVVAAIGGIAMVVFGYYDTGYATVRDDVCKANDSYLCPRCTKYVTVCDIEIVMDHCTTIKVVNTLDNRLIILYCAFIIIWAKILVVFWRRKETYWSWLWELNHLKNLVTMRSQFSIDYNSPNRSTDTGIWKNYNSGVTKLITVSIAIGLTLVCSVASVLFTYHLIELKYTNLLEKTKTMSVPRGRYTIISLVVAANLLVLSMSEKVFKKLTLVMTALENHRTHESYERSVVAKQCVYSFVCTFSIFFYFAYIKGFKYINPMYLEKEPRDIGGNGTREKPVLTSDQYNNCGPFRCMDELFVVLMVTQLLRQIIPKTLLCLRSYIHRMRTDYNQGKEQVKTIPSWEREYLLKPITMYSMLERFNYLAQQFALLTLFAPAFPLAAVLALIVNLFHIRYDAEVLLLNSRRALLIDVPGIDLWNNIFNLIAYASVVTNAGILCFTSRIAKRYVYISNHTNMTGFLFDGILSKFPLSEYKDYHSSGVTFKSEHCLYPGLMLQEDEYVAKYREEHPYGAIDRMFWYYKPNKYMYEPLWLKMLYYEVLLLLLCIHVGMCILLVIQYFIPAKPHDIEESMRVEQRIKNHFLWNKTK